MKNLLHFSPLLLCITGICLLLMIGCKKSNSKDDVMPEDQYYMRYKLDGVQKEYTTFSTADYLVSQGNLYNYALMGVDNLASLKGVVVAIWTEGPLEKKLYTEQVFPRTSVAQVMIGYKDEAGVQYSSLDPRIIADADAKVTISEISATAISGTFSGKVLTSDLKSSHTLSEGKFVLKRSR